MLAGRGLRAHAARHIAHHNIAAVCFEHGFAARRLQSDFAAAGQTSQIPAHFADSHIAAARGHRARAADPVHRHFAHARFHVQLAFDSAGIDGAIGVDDPGHAESRRLHHHPRPDRAARRRQNDALAAPYRERRPRQDAPRLGLGMRRHAQPHGVFECCRGPAFQSHRSVPVDAQRSRRRQASPIGQRPAAGFPLERRFAWFLARSAQRQQPTRAAAVRTPAKAILSHR
jgi:hypothetical protein